MNSQNIRNKTSFLVYLKNLVIHSSDLFSISTFLLFVILLFANWVGINNAFVNTVSSYAAKLTLPLLILLLLKSGYQIWKAEVNQISLPKFTLIDRPKSFQLTNTGTIHPDSQCNVSFELNISNSTGLAFTIKGIKIISEKVFAKYFTKLLRTRIVDLQNNHQQTNLPIKICNGSSENLFVEFGYEAASIKIVDSKYPNIPSHIIDFALNANDIRDLPSTIEIKYMLDGTCQTEVIDYTIPFSLYKEHFISKWLEYGWDDAVKIIKKEITS
jgi:hypothetical protein